MINNPSTSKSTGLPDHKSVKTVLPETNSAILELLEQHLTL